LLAVRASATLFETSSLVGLATKTANIQDSEKFIMQKPGPFRIVAAGLVAGSLGATIDRGFLALLGESGQFSHSQLLTVIFAGAAWGVLFAALFRMLPRHYLAQIFTAAALTTAFAWLFVFPAHNVQFSTALAAKSFSANIVYGIVAMFVLRQAIGLALPAVAMSRRADEFEDHPAGA